jgi:hypothetical protein
MPASDPYPAKLTGRVAGGRGTGGRLVAQGAKQARAREKHSYSARNGTCQPPHSELCISSIGKHTGKDAGRAQRTTAEPIGC